MSQISTKVILDSVSAAGARLTTLAVVMPRFILPEFNTHRVFSRNSASSRARPVKRQIMAVMEAPFVPESFGKGRPGMQATESLEGSEHREAVRHWVSARDHAVFHTLSLLMGQHLGRFIPDPSRVTTQSVSDALSHYDAEKDKMLDVHKQIANRLLEPFMWHEVLVSSTEWDNFFALRDHKDAQPEIERVAKSMRAAMAASTPKESLFHMPYIDEPFDRSEVGRLLMISAARCARVSYTNYQGESDPEDDLRLANQLYKAGHMSPFEHQASSELIGANLKSGNFVGWVQSRQTLVSPRDPGLFL